MWVSGAGALAASCEGANGGSTKTERDSNPEGGGMGDCSWEVEARERGCIARTNEGM